MTLRPYQRHAVDELYKWLRENKGNVVLNLPTGSGKSHIIASICEEAIKGWPETKILMLTGQRELISQNAEKMRGHYPNAPLGIFSAGLNQKDIDSITFAGVQSIRGKSHLLGHLDLILIDEAHNVSHKEEGSYRVLINELLEINPKLRVIGLTASPWRLGHGLISEGSAIFDGLIEPVTIEDLQRQGFLSNLKSKRTKEQLSTEGVHKRGGEFIEKELQDAVDTIGHNETIANEIIQWGAAEDRRSWLLFCTGIDHSEHIRDLLIEKGITAETVTGKTPMKERDRILNDFRAGKIQAVTNANVLSVGFDFPGIDLIAFLRPTASPVVYCQQAGRGLRIKDHTDFCRILDFSGNIERHGPITNIIPPKKKGEEPGIPPAKLCPECDEILHTSIMVCPECGYIFPPVEKGAPILANADIMGRAMAKTFEVTSWAWDIQKTRKGDKDMMVCSYYGALSEQPIREYFCVWHDGYAGRKGMSRLETTLSGGGLDRGRWAKELPNFMLQVNALSPPKEIEFQVEGRYKTVLSQTWSQSEEDIPF